MVQRRVIGSLVGVSLALVFGALMLPLREHLGVSTAGLVLVIPVVIGAAIGGFVAGSISVVAGFLIFDFVFIPPYWTLNVGAAQNWTALFVYVVVMLLVAQVVSRLDAARAEALRSSDLMRRLSELSELLVGDQPVDRLLTSIVTAARSVFNLPGVALLILTNGHLTVAASAGDPLSADELRRLDPTSGLPISVGTSSPSTSDLRTIALSTSGGPVGMLAVRGLPYSRSERAALTTFANDAALAIERAQLREQALRTQLLEEVDRLRHGLMGAVSHDLRTPLATIVVASSTLADRADTLSKQDAQELHELIRIESERLNRLVTNLLDMTRIESGVLVVHRERVSPSVLVDDALVAMESTLSALNVKTSMPATIPDVDVDRLLVVQVLINLLDNAARHAPAHSLITVSADVCDNKVVLAVSDEGSGVAEADREDIFNRFTQFDTGGRAGLGLTIAKTFIEAHGERIWCDEAPGGGARFSFSLPVATAS